MKDPWGGWSFDRRLGEQPRSKDQPPQRTRKGHPIVYHGTSKETAEMIRKERTVKASSGYGTGVGTTPQAVSVFGIMKSKGRGAATVRLVVDKHWLKRQSVRHEVGGSGHDQFLINADIPRKAIRDVKVLDSDTAVQLGRNLSAHQFKDVHPWKKAR